MELFIRNLTMQCAALIACALLLQSCSGNTVGTALPPLTQEIVVVSSSPRNATALGKYSYRRGNYMWRNGYGRVSSIHKPGSLGTNATRASVGRRVPDAKKSIALVVS